MTPAEPIEFVAEIRLPARNTRQLGAVCEFNLTAAGELYVVVPPANRLCGVVAAAEVLSKSRSGDNLVFASDRQRVTVPPSSVRRLAIWLRDQGINASWDSGPRSRPSALAERTA